MKILTDPKYCMGVCQLFPETKEDIHILKLLSERLNEEGADIRLESESELNIEFGSLTIFRMDLPKNRKTPKGKDEIKRIYYEWLKIPYDKMIPFDAFIDQCED
jgi:hypothetical protein